ncbi:hypothetical protein BO70DRAFT_397956 [Aspergillus heteromorphus CBS 117.55]|uniref:Uncharacterized protein n=1 Tax=Aspergillus heteromorphus CBS 117.55 TaxID=1448321 RepID=A0A317VVZ5_9EURO|nr:uncharacterized protein BO70DRAFT_397956 [Aspergillus heteromorphus CBS 117.55]PWY77068.1 hypothetical protein BO70DRAFT_397956 [Aspergillus heteromorphus CBS 117.55]
MALVRDPAFWRRFSLAIHLDEEAKGSDEHKDAHLWSNNWIKKQRQKRKRTLLYGFLIFLIIVLICAGIVVVILWLKSRNWLQEKPKTTVIEPTATPA